MGLADQVDKDLSNGISAEDALSRLAAAVEQLVGAKAAELVGRIERLERVAKLDKQNLDEVDKSARQTWENLDDRVKKLEGAGRNQPPHQLGQ